MASVLLKIRPLIINEDKT